MDPNGDFSVAPLQRALFVDGVDENAEPFSGMVLALGWWSGAAKVYYLISDLTRTAPLWAPADALTQQRWYAGAAAGAPSEIVPPASDSLPQP